MDSEEKIKRFKEFFESVYHSDLVENVRLDKMYLIVDFNQLSRFDLDLSEEILEKPNKNLKLAESAIDDMNLPKEVDNFRIRFKNLPKSQKCLLKNIRSKHIGKLIFVDGVVKQKSDVRPKAKIAKFECPVCGNLISIPQDKKKFRKPNKCACGYKGKFKQKETELIDYQGIVVEEPPEELDGSEQPQRFNTVVKEDLVSPFFVKRSNPGNKVRITGVVKEIPVQAKRGGQSTKYDLVLEANYIQPMEEDYGDVEITSEDEEDIIKISKRKKYYEELIRSVAPGIYGHDRIKEAILLQFVGGVNKTGADGVKRRGDIHILLVGDPGAGKSQLLKRAEVIAPKARYVSGKGASGAGLTAAVVRDEFLGGWSLEAGALVLANGGICMIDELDKMTTEDRSAMHEALEQQSVTISKANIQATMQARTTVMAAANPKLGRFNPYEPLVSQIDLPPPLISRFDLIFPIRDVPDEEKDEKLAGFVLNLHKKDEEIKPPIETDILRKYIAYARRRVFPKLTEGSMEEIRNYYVTTRNAISEQEDQTISITTRQLEALIRLSEASAKLRLSNEVTREDAKKAIDLLEFCLKNVGMDPDTGSIDVDLISTGVTKSERNSIVTIKKIISDLESEKDMDVPVDDIVEIAEEKGIKREIVDETLEKLKRSGEIFEPKKGIIQKI